MFILHLILPAPYERVCVCTFCIEVKLHRVFYCISISRGPLGNIAVSGQRRRCNIPVQTYLQRARTQAHGSAPGRRRAQLGGTGNFQSNCYGLTLKMLLVCTLQSLVGADAPSKSQQVCALQP